jgi:hypothetical protein
VISATEEVVVLRVKGALSNLRTFANDRRRASRVDPVADAIDFCISEVEGTLAQTTDELRLLTPAQYATCVEPPVSPQTVRKWVRSGRLEAVQTGRGYLIPRSAKVRAA